MLAVIFLIAAMWWDIRKSFKVLESQNKQLLQVFAQLRDKD